MKTAYADQGGICRNEEKDRFKGCDRKFDYKDMEGDHIIGNYILDFASQRTYIEIITNHQGRKQ